MLKKIATWLAARLLKHLDPTAKEKNYLIYGLEITLAFLIEVLVILTAAHLLDIFWPVFMTSLSFIILRPYAGGFHLPRYSYCLIFSLLIFLLLGQLSQQISWQLRGLVIWLTIVALFALYMLNKYAPADTRIIPIKDQQKRLQLKKMSQRIVLIWFILALLLTFNYPSLWTLLFASSLGILVEAMALHPLTFKIVANYLPEHD